MALEDYFDKRDFEATPEPRGEPGSTATETRRGEFCVQRHAARRLHYDLRMEVGGVLKSWAVPNGPSMDPAEKRMAVHVEDHPMQYATFEGVIPKGNYGAGSMMLWDHGTYEALEDTPAEKQLERGDFKFRLHGKKLKGDFVLVRTKKVDWLLIKKKDEHVVAGWDNNAYGHSVLTGRTQEEIAQGVDSPVLSAGADQIGKVPGAIRGGVPNKLTPMLAVSSTRPPSDPGWLFEIKWDGVRSLCYLDRGAVRLVSRNGNAMDRQYPELSELKDAIDAETAILDGEIVALDERGLPSFGLLQKRMHVGDPGTAAAYARSSPVTLYVFDIVYLNGWDLRGCAIEDRRRLLKSVIAPTRRIRLSDEFIDQGEPLFALARQSGLEGIVAKRLGSRYESRRTGEWIKIKVTQQQEFVICGYTTGDRDYFSSLVLGLYESPEADRLLYVGNVGTGFDRATLEFLWSKLHPIETTMLPFQRKPEMMHPPVWTLPDLVCEVKFSSWTEDKHLRAPVYVGLRNDINPRDCIADWASSAAEDQAIWTAPSPLLTGSNEKVILDVEGRRLTFTNLNKVYYPRDSVVKRDVLNYYYQVSDLLLPHLRDRALSLRRYPDGIDGESFFQKDAAEHFPSWLRIEPIYSAHNDAPINYVVADDCASLLYLVNLGCIDQNPWMSRVEALENPDFLLIDLDPQDCGYDRIVEAAQLVRQKLDKLELVGFPKTTGGDGMHVYVPIEPVYTYEMVRSVTEVIARLLAVARPDLFTTPRAVTKREKGKVYFDWQQISTGKTISAPYVLRAHPGAPVATPLEWREVRPGLLPQHFHLRNALERFARVGDLFAGVLSRPQRLDGAIEKLDQMIRREK